MVGMFVRTLCLFALALVIGWVHSATRSTPIAFKDRDTAPPPPEVIIPAGGDETQTETDPREAGEPQPDPLLDAEVLPGQITLRESLHLYEFGATFLDARRLDEYDEGRIAGSYWMAATRVGTPASFEIIDLLDPANPIVIYCTGGDCDASENTKRRLMLLGIPFAEIHIMGAGYEDWVRAGLPVEGAGVDGSLAPDGAAGANDPAGG